MAALTRDDAAVFRLSNDRAIVATLDFFTPIVDDAYAFGAIAAANAFSDLYAMGATPLLALSIVAWPRDAAMLAILGDTVRGAADVCREAGAFILGGHSIDDREPKFGLVAIGEVHPEHVRTNAGARPGDHLVLTKPIGTGILSTALKRDLLSETEMESAVRTMTTLNAGAARAVAAVGKDVHAVTDVTGFGLIGHLRNVLVASGVAARVVAGAVPLFSHVPRLVTEGAVPGGTERNVEAANIYTEWNVDETSRTILCDAQTSGGLLIAVAPGATATLVEHLERASSPAAAIIGEITKGSGNVVVTQGRS